MLAANASAEATLIPLDSRFGPDTILRDPETGLDWLALPVPVTAGLSYNKLLAATSPGGSFAEFRLADIGELSGLLQSFGLALSSVCQGPCFARAKEFSDLFGGKSGRVGPIEFDSPEDIMSYTFHMILYSNDEVLIDSQRVEIFFPDVPLPFFLISSPNQVPEPAVLSLVVAGLAGWGLLGRRRMQSK